MVFSSKARQLEDCLLSLHTRVREIRGVELVDRAGLSLVSTLASGGFEEGLAAFAGMALSNAARAQSEFEMGPVYYIHIAARDRQIFVAPVTGDVAMAAVTDAGATPSTVALHLLATCREILAHIALLEKDES